MQAALIALTLAALALCAVMAAVTWRVLRDERRRSAARVALLEAGLREAAPGATPPVRQDAAAAPTAEPARLERSVPPAPVVTAAAAADEGVATTPRNAAPAEQTVIHADRDAPAGVALADGSMFATTARAPGFGRWAWAVAAVAILVVGAAVMATMSSGSGRGALALDGVREAPAQPLELLSLEHRREGDTLLVSGAVRNPGDGPAPSGLTAVVLFFDRRGTLVSSSSAAIDPSTLTPGAQARFSVSLERAGTIGRYRVSFKSADRVVPHLDRRGGGAVLRAER